MSFSSKLRAIACAFLPESHRKTVWKWFAANGDKTLRLDYALDANSLVMDMGGYRGDWAHDIHEKYGCKVIVFEPVKQFAEKIKKRFDGNPNIRVEAIALGSENKQEQISLSEDGSSVYDQSQGGAKTAIEFQEKRKERYSELKIYCDNFKNEIKTLENDDFTRLVVLTKSGKELYENLLKKGIAAEMYTDSYVVFIATLADDEAKFERLIKAIKEI